MSDICTEVVNEVMKDVVVASDMASRDWLSWWHFARFRASSVSFIFFLST